jgi:anthranilate synthase component 2
MKALIIDNYDSFTYNLYQYIGEVMEELDYDFDIDVYRNDKIDLDMINSSKYDKIVISPGPGSPEDEQYFGVCSEVLLKVSPNIETLGVCLGMQGLAHVYGGKVIKANQPMHGKPSNILHDQKGLFKDIPQELEVMRYHSLVVEESSLPDELEVSARTINNPKEIMGIRHKRYPIEAIQFHPESFATEGGKKIIANFLRR